jgi:hypothetical protein
MSEKIARRHFLRVAAGAGAAAALVVTNPVFASGKPSASALTEASVRGLSPTGFKATARLGEDGWTRLDSAVQMKLDGVTSLPKFAPMHHKRDRAPYRMAFDLPASTELESATYSITHPQWREPQSIFLVRVGPESNRATYEAIFA